MAYKPAGWKEYAKLGFMIALAILIGLIMFSCSALSLNARIDGVDNQTNYYIAWVQTSNWSCETKATKIADYLAEHYPHSKVYLMFLATGIPDAYHVNVEWHPAAWSDARPQIIETSPALGDFVYRQYWRKGYEIDYEALEEAIKKFWGES